MQDIETECLFRILKFTETGILVATSKIFRNIPLIELQFGFVKNSFLKGTSFVYQ